MNNVIQSIDVVIGAGNPGAVGVRLRGAQASHLQDVTVEAGDGAIGIAALAGSGGGHSNVTVRGGRFGIDGRLSQPGPTLSGVIVDGSTCAGILYSGLQTLSLSGANVSVPAGVPAVVAGFPLPVYFPNSAFAGQYKDTGTGTGPCILPDLEDAQGPDPALSGQITISDSVLSQGGAASSAQIPMSRYGS